MLKRSGKSIHLYFVPNGRGNIFNLIMCGVCCRPFIDSIYQVEEIPSYSEFTEFLFCFFYYEWILIFFK